MRPQRASSKDHTGSVFTQWKSWRTIPGTAFAERGIDRDRALGPPACLRLVAESAPVEDSVLVWHGRSHRLRGQCL